MSFPKYESYKDSGVEWLGEIPSHWKVVPLIGAASERAERNVGMVESNLLSLSYGRIVRKDITSNDGLLPESFETYQIVQPGDIIWRLTDLQNDQRSLRTALVSEVGIITSAYLATTPTSILPKFFGYLLRACDLKKVFYSMGGGLRQSMKFADVKRLPILLPAMSEQSAIASFLDRETSKIDTLITEQQRLIDLLKEKRKGVISRAVTEGLNPDAPMKDSGIGLIAKVPAHWSCLKLSRLARSIGDGLHGTPVYVEQSDFYFVNGNNLCDGSIRITDQTRCVSYDTAATQCITLTNDTVLISINGTIGNLALYEDEKIMLGKSAAYITCNELLDRAYLIYYLQTNYVKIYFELQLTGTTIFNLSLESLRNTPILLPPLKEQRQIANVVKLRLGKLDALIKDAEQSISLLQERRSALISAAVTGKIDVRGLTVAKAEAA